MNDEVLDGTVTDLEKLECTFNELGIRYKREGRNAGRKQLIKEDGKTEIKTSIIVDQSCYRLRDGQDVLAKWDAYTCFFFYFDFDEDGKFIKCGAFE